MYKQRKINMFLFGVPSLSTHYDNYYHNMTTSKCLGYLDGIGS